MTGGGSGIARATVLKLLTSRARVVTADVNAAALDDLVREAAAGDRLLPLTASVMVQEDVRRIVDTTMDRWGRIDVLVNCVGGSTGPGFPTQVPFHEMTMEYWEAAVAFNLHTAVRCTMAVLPIMTRQRSGTVINLASTAAFGMNMGSTAVYASAKAGIVAFTKRLALETGPLGIRVNCVAPGLTMTNRVQKWLDEKTSEQRAAIEASFPLGRAGVADEQAAVIAFLASDLASYMNGACVDVNGGRWA